MAVYLSRFYLPRVYKTTPFLFGGNFTTKLRFHEAPFLNRSFCVSNGADDSSFTVSYLVKSCGLPEEKAISISKKLQLKSSSQPDKVLALLNHEFPNDDVFKIVEKLPSILLSDADRTLKPKIEYLRSVGFSAPHLIKLLSKSPFILHRSLEKRIVPCVVFLESILPSKSDLTVMIIRAAWLFSHDPQERLSPNIALLRSHGVPDHIILKGLVRNPTTLVAHTTESLNLVIEEAKAMQFDPSKFTFLRAIQALTCLSKTSWEAKVVVYKSWGWSDDHIRKAFRKQPQCMMLSKTNIIDSMEFIVNKLGYDPLLIARYPLLLMFSMEKRTIPRLSVLRVLISNNLVEKDCNINTVMQMTNDVFLKRYITQFEEQLPQLVDVYKGKKKAVPS